MGTFEHKEIVDEIISFNGERDPDDLPGSPVAVKVVEYTSRGGRRVWGVVYRGANGQVLEDELRYERESEYIGDPKVIWQVSP